ncbi:hypothetical protein ES703_72897 [subsurface metagenome]
METLLVNKRKFTYDDYLKIPDDRQYELVEGELIMTPSPVPYHQWILKNIANKLDNFVQENKLGRIFIAPCDVQLDNENVLQPDIMHIAEKRLKIIGEKNITDAPDLIVEVLSESSAYRDLVRKKKLYAQFGVREYWIVDPGEKSIEIYSLRSKKFFLFHSYSTVDILKSPLLSGFKLELKAVFDY